MNFKYQCLDSQDFGNYQNKQNKQRHPMHAMILCGKTLTVIYTEL
jgi:hypothetical protein